jgi:peptide/nickel transport system permease protein
MSETPQMDAEPVSLASAMRNTYWGKVGRVFWRSILARVAVAWIILILLLTVLIPFLANSSPYTVIVDGHREWPLFRNLTRVDLIWLVWGLAICVYAVAHGVTRWRGRELSEIRAVRTKWFLYVLCGAVVATTFIAIAKRDYLDEREYHLMLRAGKLEHAVFPPLRWGFADREPLDESRMNEPPSHDHWFGTDRGGRDVLARLLWSARVVFEIGLVSEIIALFIGVIYGALMGYFVGKVDMLGMRVLEIVESVPLLFLLITFVAVFGRELFLIMVIIGVTGWTGIARFVRAEFLRIRQTDYVSAAKALGLPLPNILFRHMLPNSLTPVIVTLTFGVAANIVSESILSFLGVGVEPPTASWGAMLADAGNPGVAFYWWMAFGPGLMIFFTVFACNILGESFRDAIDPRSNKVE